jgi:hypothetical protein
VSFVYCKLTRFNSLSCGTCASTDSPHALQFLIKAKDQASQLEAYNSDSPDAAAARELLAIARRIAAIGNALKARGDNGSGGGANPSADGVRADLAARRRQSTLVVAASAPLARAHTDINVSTSANASAEAAVMLALQLQSRAESRHRAETLGVRAHFAL